MNAMGAYVLRICCCALIAGVIQSIGADGPSKKIRKMITGLFMAFVIISPLREVKLGELLDYPEDLYLDGKNIGAAAQADATDAISDIIIQQTRAYILDEATSLDVQIEVSHIDLDPDTLAPVQVELTGDVSPYVRSLLSDSIATNLGIQKEDQIWNS